MTLPFPIPRWAWALAGLIGIALSIWWLRADAYSDGERAERTRWEQRIAADKAAQRERERIASDNLRQQQAKDTAAAAERKEAIDEATKHIPDQGLSARQRARAELELRRQAEAKRRN